MFAVSLPSKVNFFMYVLAERDRANQERFTPSGRGMIVDLLISFQALMKYNQTMPCLGQLFKEPVAESINEHYPNHEFFIRRQQNGRQQNCEA